MRIILMEFNELCPQLMHEFMDAGELPNFKRFYNESQVFTTESDEVAPNLEPWIQWVSVHTGVPYAKHGIQHLGDGHKLEYDNIWDIASDAGKRVFVCGSMNINYRRPINGWVLPDPWAGMIDPYPKRELAPYYRFVSANVQEHTREEAPLSRRDQIDFLRFMATHGLGPATVGAIAKQLVAERSSKTGWKRAVLLDRLQYDLFRWHYKRYRPDLATFFLNSTAHYQHLYWRHFQPEAFEVKPDPGEQATYGEAIPFGYRQMDRICGRFMKLAADDVALVFLTAMSQQPCLKYEDVGGKRMYRPKDFGQFAQRLELGDAEAIPVMAEEFHLDFESGEAADAAAARLAAITYEGRPAMRVELRDSNVFVACDIAGQVADDAVLRLDGNSRSIPFFELFYQLDLVKSGIHHPDGLLWIRTPSRTHGVVEERIPLVDVAPTLLSMLGVEAPRQMSEERIAVSA